MTTKPKYKKHGKRSVEKVDSEEFLDLEKGDIPKIEQKEISKEKFQNLTPEENELLQNLLQKLNAESVQQTTTNA